MRGSDKEIVFQTTVILALTAVSTYPCELFSTIKYIKLDPKSRLTGDNSVYFIAIKASEDRGRMFLLNAGTIYQTTRCHAPDYNMCLRYSENLVFFKCNVASGNRRSVTQASLP